VRHLLLELLLLLRRRLLRLPLDVAVAAAVVAVGFGHDESGERAVGRAKLETCRKEDRAECPEV